MYKLCGSLDFGRRHVKIMAICVEYWGKRKVLSLRESTIGKAKAKSTKYIEDSNLKWWTTNQQLVINTFTNSNYTIACTRHVSGEITSTFGCPRDNSCTSPHPNEMMFLDHN